VRISLQANLQKRNEMFSYAFQTASIACVAITLTTIEFGSFSFSPNSLFNDWGLGSPERAYAGNMTLR
jgi:hypothetical protein